MAAEEEILSLFDYYWFEYKISKAKPISTAPEPNPVFEISEKPKLCSNPTLHDRSLSDHCLSSTDSLSPNSVLITPKLQTILSGKESGEFSEPLSKQVEIETAIKKTGSEIRKRRRRKQGRTNGNSKSSSELEFEELKGFMDLGFVFPEEDKGNSSLVSIVPGLQRLGRKVVHTGFDGEEEEDEMIEKVGFEVSRPYLSEAWDHVSSINQQRNNKVEINPVMDWRIPAALGNEMEIKDHLRIWAHTVASTVRCQ